MAKIKIIGYNDLVPVPRETAIRIKNGIADGSIKSEDYVEIGAFYGKVKNIVSFFIEEKYQDPVFTGMEDYLHERNKILALSLKEIVDRQKSYFDLFTRITESNGSFEDYRDKTEEYMKEHPYRIWCCPLVWTDDKYRSIKNFGIGAMGIIENVERAEVAYENDKIAEMAGAGI